MNPANIEVPPFLPDSAAVRTRDFLYIRNFEPDRWPAGDPIPGEMNNPPNPYGDIDDSPTLSYLLENQNSPSINFYSIWRLQNVLQRSFMI